MSTKKQSTRTTDKESPIKSSSESRRLKARVQFCTLNQGTSNEHLIVTQQFQKPGTYSYSTRLNETVPRMKPVDEMSLNRGLSLAAQLIEKTPVVIPSVEQVLPESQEQK